MISLKNILACALISVFTPSLAAVHTWHNIAPKAGTWTATLQSISENAHFVDANGKPTNNFIVSAAQPGRYGFGFGPDDDFNVAYTLTLTEKTANHFSDKTCVYVITAQGPGIPDIKALSYHGAVCDVKRVVTTDFVVG